MALSLQDLIVKNGLSSHQLDQVSEEHLLHVSRIIAEHDILGFELGLSNAEMVAINADGRTHELKKMGMLRAWKQKFAFRATYRRLIEALLKCSRGGEAQKVCELQVSLLHCLLLVLATLPPHTRPIVVPLAQMEPNMVCSLVVLWSVSL